MEVIILINIRKSSERGHTQLGWLNSYHSFSFSEYYDPNFMGFQSLRVINEDYIQPAKGFGMHPHRNMEIITYVVEGSLEHKDSMGTGSTIIPGEIQRMSAGTGVQHSEFNHSKTNPLHLLQIWIIPNEKNLQPSYEQKTIKQEKNKLILIGSPHTDKNSIIIHQDVELFSAELSSEHTLNYELKNGRVAWLQLIKGKININEQQLSAGDGASISALNKIEVKCIEAAEFLLFDLK